jgi:hypothetical protein
LLSATKSRLAQTATCTLLTGRHRGRTGWPAQRPRLSGWIL